MSSTVQSSLIDQLQKKCRFWKRVAVTALSALLLVIVFGFAYTHQQAGEYQDEIQELKDQIQSMSGADDGSGEERPNVLDAPIEPLTPPGTKK